MVNMDKMTIKEELDLEMEMTEDDIIAKLMEDAPLPKRRVLIDRLGVPITLKALTEKEISKLKKDCTKEKKLRGGRREKELDDDEFNIALIEKSAISPNFNNEKLLKSMNVSSGREVIRRKFLAGELSALSENILEISGFDNELEELDIKN